MSWLINWAEANTALLGWLGAVSVFLLCLTVFVTPWLVAQLPHDYFAQKTTHSTRRTAADSHGFSLGRSAIKFFTQRGWRWHHHDRVFIDAHTRSRSRRLTAGAECV